jgi:FkbM family methyltransferase
MSMNSALNALKRRILDVAPLRAAAQRVLLRADAFIPFGHGLAFDPRTWVIKETQYGFRIWVALGERSISREIMLDRYERDEVAFVRATVKPGDRVVDVGANIGFYTALLATLVGPAGSVIACEPLDSVADALERTIAENAYGDRVTLHRVALDAQRGEVCLRHAPLTINAGAAYLAPAAALPAGHVDATVSTRTLDDVVGAGRCDFIKLDAEGAEPRIFAGAAGTLTRCRPIVLAELNPLLLNRVAGKTAGDVIAQLASYGYATRRLNGGPTDRIERYDGAANVNVVFSPLERGNR